MSDVSHVKEFIKVQGPAAIRVMIHEQPLDLFGLLPAQPPFPIGDCGILEQPYGLTVAVGRTSGEKEGALDEHNDTVPLSFWS